MTERIAVHRETVGSVTATVHRIPDFISTYEVTIESALDSGAEFRPEELPQVSQAVEQARLFICLQEQISRMNWCPGCGD